MDSNMHAYLEQLVQNGDVQSVLLVDKAACGAMLDLGGADVLCVIVINRAEPHWKIRSVLVEGRNILEHYISQWQFEYWAVHGANERVASWLKQGNVVFDRQDYMRQMKERFIRLPDRIMKRKVCEEYSRLVRHYQEAKDLLKHQQTADACQAVIHALNAWARLTACEAGVHPEMPIWSQVKHIDPSVYKLYEELLDSREPLEKRIELLLLAIEFSITSKMKSCTQFLTDILQTQNRPWSLTELRQHPEVTKGQIDLPILLDKMVKRSILQEVFLRQDGSRVYEKAYMLVG